MMRAPFSGLDAEIRDHIARETQDNIDRGMAPDEARRAAWRAFGSVASTQEDVRSVWIPVRLEQLAQDGRYALRSVRRSPFFSAVVIATLAIGIGMTTAVFGVFNAILLRPLAYPDAGRLVAIASERPDLPGQFLANNEEFWHWKEQSASLDALFAYNIYNQTMNAGAEPSRMQVAVVSDDFWKVSEPHLLAGRLPDEGERNVVLLSERLYARTFDSDPRVLGRVVTLDRTPVTVIGILPDRFRLELPIQRRQDFRGGETEIFRSFAIEHPNDRFRQLLSVVGRVKPGVTVDQARAELSAVHERTRNRQSESRLVMLPLQEQMVRDVRQALNVLLMGAALLLLAVCTNVADLLLARVTARSKEMAVRVSVGAGRSRVLRQLLFESVAYCGLGGAAAFVIARSGLAAIIRVYPDAAPRLAEASLDRTVMAVSLAVLAAVALFVGVMPALSLWRANVHDILKEGGRTASAAPRRLRLRRTLVGAQLALAVALLCGAGLLLKSFWAMNAHPAGFNPEQVLALRLNFTEGLPGPAKVDMADRVLARIKALPGVTAASVNSHGDLLTWIDVVGAPEVPPGERRPFFMNQTSPDFAVVMGLRTVSGRWLADHEPSPVVVLNETAARMQFGREDPIGRRIRGAAIGAPQVRRDPNPAPTEATVVGVVADLRYTKLDEEPLPEFFLPYEHARSIYRMNLIVRTSGDPLAVAPSVRAALGESETRERPFDVTTLDAALSESIAPRRFNLVVLETFAVTALLLALVGIYAVMSYSITQREQELGIRAALGAGPRQVMVMLIRQEMSVALAGIVIGLVAAFALTRAMRSLLFAVTPDDPLTFVAAAGLLAIAALLACFAPARRGALVNPLQALRAQ